MSNSVTMPSPEHHAQDSAQTTGLLSVPGIMCGYTHIPLPVLTGTAAAYNRVSYPPSQSPTPSTMAFPNGASEDYQSPPVNLVPPCGTLTGSYVAASKAVSNSTNKTSVGQVKQDGGCSCCTIM